MTQATVLTSLAQAIGADVKSINASLATKALATDLTAGTATEVGTTGAKQSRSFTVVVAPPAASVQQLHATQTIVQFTGSYPINSGGWVVAQNLEAQINSAQAVDKMVCSTARVQVQGGSRVDKLLVYEGLINGLDSISSVNQACVYYSPNMVAISGISRVDNLYAFGNDYSGASIKNVGRYLKALDRTGGSVLKEVAPARFPGYVTDRYYGPSCAYNPQPVACATGVAEACTIDIRERCTFSKIGCYVTTAGAAGATLRLGIYNLENGIPTSQIYGSAALAATAVGAVEATAIATTLEAGTYMLVAAFSAAVSINFLTSWEARGFWGRTTPTGEEFIARFAYTYAAFPSVWANVPVYQARSGAIPDLWLRK